MYEYGDDLFATSSYATSNGDHFLLGNVPEIPTSSSFVFPDSTLNNFPARVITESNEFGDNSFNETLLLAALKSEVVDDYSSSNINSSSSSSVNYGSAPSPSCYMQRPSSIQRSMSISDSFLQRNGYFHPKFSSLEEYGHDILNLDTGPMRKVFSTGDIQEMSTTQRSRQLERTTSLHENSLSTEAMKKVGRYSAEERKERIERYRSKRTQRNFTKKIKYACRKTLADSRPRVRGRFMRNEEPGESSQTQWNQMIGREYEDDEVWINFLDALSMNQIP